MRQHCLVLGGARSGKSAYAEGLARSHPGDCIYIATAESGDAEMHARIALHRARRGSRWRTVEEPLKLLPSLSRESKAGRFILVDCVTLWISNLLLVDLPVQAAVDELCHELPALEARIVFVSNEVGLGIVPDNALARRYRDEAGLANQKLAASCTEVVFMAAGLPLRLKG
jgi:adenosylcobinamide kinase / adenosylcobinamide-phosphate guanylyltransferase